MPETLRYIAPAKINLGLEILRRRPDGYHEIRTIFYRVLEPHDSMEVTPSDFFRFTCSDDSLPTDERNLVIRAARLFAASTGMELPTVHVHLEKHIPAGAGLGGGSSDAATMLRILEDAYAQSGHGRTTASSQTPEARGIDTSKIGADVPFFYSEARAALATGIGEILTPIDLHIPASILIVVDLKIPVSTREAYAGLNPNSFRDAVLTEAPMLTKDGGVRNDFEPSVFARYPRLAEIKEAMYDRGAHFSLMTGSGSAIYGIFQETEKAERAKQAFQEEGLLAYLR